MSLGSRMREECELWGRGAGDDAWTLLRAGLLLSVVVAPLAGGRQELAPRAGARRSQALLDPEVTHTARTLEPASTFARGQRLRRVSDGSEWVVRAVRFSAQVGVGHTQLALMLSEATIGGGP